MTNQWHQMAVDKGWHDNDEMGPDGTPSARQRIAWAGLILSEWSEYQDEALASKDRMEWIIKDGKPCGIISELVDIWIRGADTLGACGAPLSGDCWMAREDVIDQVSYCLGKGIEGCREGGWYQYAMWIRGAMAEAKQMAGNYITKHGIQWDEALRLKTAYNATRSHRHGGKLA